MSQENVEIVRAALNAFAQLDEGLVGPEHLDEFFARDTVSTYTGFAGFIEEGSTLLGADESSSSAPPGWSHMTTSATSR